jgi:hypothetical protein
MLGVGGCGVDRDYEAAVRANTIVALDDYLRLHPDGAHAADARRHLAALVEEREWRRAQSQASADGYQQYLRGYPNGAHSKEALLAIADLNLMSVPSTEAGRGAAPPAGRTAAATGASRGTIARRAAPVPPAAQAAADRGPVADTHGTRVQLGAFAGEDAAQAAWAGIRTRHPELGGHALVLVPATLADGRRLERLQLGGFDRDSADATCAALKKAQEACVVVPPTGSASH